MNDLESRIRKWTQAITEAAPLPVSCEAIYVGFFESESTFYLHFLGSVEYDPESDDWACTAEGDYLPADRYLDSGIPTSTGWREFANAAAAIIKAIDTRNSRPGSCATVGN